VNDHIRPITFDDLLRLASRVTIPDVVDDENTIGAGQLWLARWDTFREFVLVATADLSHPVVVPVTFDDTHELDEPDRVQTDSLGVGRAHWALPKSIPAIALGHLVEAEIPLSNASSAENTHKPQGGDSRRDELWADLESFDAGGNGQLGARLREVGSTPSTLAKQLGVTGGDALDLLKGRLLPTPAMAESIATLLSTTPGAVLGMLGAIPNGLRRDLAKRTFRNVVRDRARQRTWSDSAAWKQVAFGTLAMPYRTTGGSADDDWEARIQRYLEVDDEP
jgi:hypothetical protein